MKTMMRISLLLLASGTLAEVRDDARLELESGHAGGRTRDKDGRRAAVHAGLCHRLGDERGDVAGVALTAGLNRVFDGMYGHGRLLLQRLPGGRRLDARADERDAVAHRNML